MTKTALYSLCYLEGNDGFGNNRLYRNIKYIQYYRTIQAHLGFDRIVLADNASQHSSLNALLAASGGIVDIMRFDNHLGRRGDLDYPYAWRGVYAIQELIKAGFEKIIMIDSDCFVLTSRLVDHIRNLNTGWETFWCNKYQWPEASVSILCKDTFSIFYSFIGQERWEDRKGDAPMEILLPFTKVNKDFNSDRWGEENLEQMPSMDLYCQARDEFKPMFF